MRRLRNCKSEKHAEILKKCETLRQYSRFVEIVRSYGHIDQLTGAVMVKIMEQCKKEGVLTEFMEHYGTELIEMLFKELTREEDLEISRLDGYDAGVKDGEKSGFSKGEKSGFSKGEKSGFTKGEKSGFTKGEQSGISKGERKAALDIAKGMQKEHIASDVIAKITGLTLAEVESL